MTTEMPTIFQDAGLDNLTLEFVYHALLSPLWPYRFREANKAQDITLRESLGVDSLVLCKLRLKSKDCFGNTSLTTLCRVSTLSLWRNILLFCLLVRKFVCLLLRKNLIEKKKCLGLKSTFLIFPVTCILPPKDKFMVIPLRLRYSQSGGLCFLDMFLRL